MDLVPKPDQVVAAAGNAAHLLFYGGVADLRPMPRTLIDEGPLRELYHYRPAETGTGSGDPVLLVTPLAAPALCFDLRRGCSVVEYLVNAGRPTYLVEYGAVSFRDRAVGLEHWVEDAVPAAIRRTSEHAGGRPVHVVGWSLGGIFAMLSAAADADLPIASLSVLGAPVDVTKVPLVAPLRPLLTAADWPGTVTRIYRTLGGAPPPLVRWAFQLTSVQKIVTKPVAMAVHLDDRDWLAQVEAVDRFTSAMTAYPGRSFGQLYHRFAMGNALASGTVQLGSEPVSLSSVQVPTLICAGATDGIAPVAAVRAAVPLLDGAPEVRFEIVPGGHLGMLTGRAARSTTWPALEGWFGQWDSPPPDLPARKRATKKTSPKKTSPKKSAARKSAAKKTATATAAEKTATKRAPRKSTTRAESARSSAVESGNPGAVPSIGTNPRRRHGSAGSRGLAPGAPPAR